MKLSAKKRGEIYDLIHKEIVDMRVNIRVNYLNQNDVLKNRIDYVIAQLEIPLAQKLMALLDPSYKKG
jgi:hypothetical protein